MFYILRWFSYFTELINGFVGTITLGFINLNFSLWGENLFLNYCEKYKNEEKIFTFKDILDYWSYNYYKITDIIFYTLFFIILIIIFIL